MNVAIYIFASIGALITSLALFLAFSWWFVRAVTGAALRRKAEKLRALTPPQTQSQP